MDIRIVGFRFHALQQTIWKPISAFHYPMDAVVGLHLLAQHGNSRVSDECSIQCIRSFPGYHIFKVSSVNTDRRLLHTMEHHQHELWKSGAYYKRFIRYCRLQDLRVAKVLDFYTLHCIRASNARRVREPSRRMTPEVISEMFISSIK